MGLFVIGNIIAAMAPTYGWLMAGRIVTALCHGAFFGIGSVVATDAVSPDKRARAIALMMTGLTLANVLGVPLGTLLAQHFGWRSMFWAIAFLGAVGLVGITILVPYHTMRQDTHLAHELAMFKRPQVWLSLAVTVMGFGGVFAVFAYIAQVMTVIAGFSTSNLVYLLFLFGLGLVLGNILGGRAADRSLLATLCILFIALASILFVFTFTAQHQISAAITLFLLGVVGFAIVSPVQMQIVQQAKDAPTLASATNVAAFNIGIAAGTYLGGLTIHLGFGYTSVNWVGGILVTIGLILQILVITLTTNAKVR